MAVAVEVQSIDKNYKNKKRHISMAPPNNNPGGCSSIQYQSITSPSLLDQYLRQISGLEFPL